MDWYNEWVAARKCLQKTESLLGHMEKIQLAGLASLSDKQAAARRTWMETVSLESKRRVMEKKESDICWRNKEAEQGQRSLTIQSLKRSLVKMRERVETTTRVARTKLSEEQFWSERRKLKEETQRLRRKEQCRSRQKLKNIRRREENCAKHVICRWARSFQTHLQSQGSRRRDKLTSERVVETGRVVETETEVRDREDPVSKRSELMRKVEQMNGEIRKTKDSIVTKKMVTVYGDLVINEDEHK